MEEQDIDFTKLKYVLYARKSTDDPQRQVRSIGDQIFECKQLAARLGINVVKVLEETKSAKKPNGRIAELKDQLTNPEQDKLSIEQFLNLSKNAGVVVQSANQIIKDQICREIFLNLTVDETKVLSCQLKPHFAEMLKSKQQRTSRGGALTLEHLQPLVDSILDNWNPATFEEQLHIIQSINNNPQMQYNQLYEY